MQSSANLLDVESGFAVGVGAAKRTRDHGLTWEVVQTSNTTLYGLASDGTTCVAVGGGDGRLQTSPDGVTWTARAVPTTATLKTVVYGGGQWVAAGDAGVVYTSPDAVTWTQQTTTRAPSSTGCATRMDSM